MCQFGSNSGQLQSLVHDACLILLAVMAVYFFVGLVQTIVNVQVTQGSGDRIGHAHTLQQGIYLVVLAVLAASFSYISPVVVGIMCPEGASSLAWQNPPSLPASAQIALDAWKALGHLVVSIMVGGAWILTVIYVVNAGLELQINHALGIPHGIAQAGTRIVILLLGGVLTIASIAIANEILTLIYRAVFEAQTQQVVNVVNEFL